MNRDIIIIGGGASGLMLAANLDLNTVGLSGVILEKTGSAGTKLLMSGGGRCNITHGGSVKELVKAYGKAGPALRKCLYRHSSIELAEWLEENGVALADECGDPVYSWMLHDQANDIGRIFPSSMKASDIRNLLLAKSESNGWKLITCCEVQDIRQDEDGRCTRVITSQGEFSVASSIVMASGGITFPETGSDGSMFNIARNLGIGITDLRSALAPVYVDEYPYRELSGISIPDATVTVFTGENGSMKKAARMTGSLLFTHRGFSGPVILNLSRYVMPGSVISISYGKSFDILPKRVQQALRVRAAGPSGDIRTSVLSSLTEKDDFTVSSVDENGMVTSGGISLSEIDMKTMRITQMSEIGHGVSFYAVGEAIDADGITGGYNLQMCWSTACTAADSIIEVSGLHP